jgi:tetratricopeptide (TPR) repeat protein
MMGAHEAPVRSRQEHHIMRSRFRWLRALLVSAAVAGTAGFIPNQPAVADEQATPSKEIAKQLKAAQDAIKAKKYDEAFAKLKEAEGFGKKTPLDQHLINVLLGRAYFATKDYTQAAKYFDAELSDGVTKEAEQQQLIKVLTSLSYDQKNYDKAIDYATRALKANPGDDKMRTFLVQSYYEKGDWKSLKKLEDDQIGGQLKKGETPKAESLQMLQAACMKLGDAECETRSFEVLVQYYPKPEYWQNLFYELEKSAQTDRDHLQLYRLMLEVNVLKRPDRYREMALLALDAGSPGEAVSVLQKGFEAKVFADKPDQDKNQRLLDSAKKNAASDTAALAQREKPADAAQSGDEAVKLGYDYLGYEQYEKSIAWLAKGIAKGGLTDEASARLLLGVAQFRAGHRDDAIKSFHSVKGDKMIERIANLWSLHAKQPDSVARR